MKTRIMWLGLGAAALTSPVVAQPTPTTISTTALDAALSSARCTSAARLIRVTDSHHTAEPAKTDAGGEGGEGGEGSATKADADSKLDPLLRFYRDIQLVRGHLLVGDELVRAERWTEALPHFLHPVEELYEGLGPQMTALRLKPFVGQLKALAQTVKAKNAVAYAAALTAVNTQLDQVDAGVKGAKSDWMPFAVETALEAMRSAIGEYGESIEDGKFAKAVEYQDSRGFVWQADKLLTSIDADLVAKFPDAARKARTEIDALKAAWPGAVPPAVPVMDAAQVASAVSRVELALGQVK
jgi:hypothetical protein